jgi:IgGFc binding protein
MIPPVRTWGKTYYATNYAQPPEMYNHDVARYLFIGSQPGQTIYRYDCLSLGHTECVIDNDYGIYWDELESGQKFWSDAPFLCVSYVNSATYPDGVNGLGDPAETVIPSREQFTKTVVFETPISVGNIVPYSNYVNIICKINDAKNVTMDGKPILGIPPQCIDDTFEVFTIPRIGPGVHVIQSDSGIGVYGYGYGYDETYAWSSPSGVTTFHSLDSIAPVADTLPGCYQAFIHVADSGNLPDTLGLQTGLAAIWPDSSYNIAFQHDADWTEGSGADTGGYTATVIDPAKPGILIVRVYDRAGNLTAITTSYKPNDAKIEPALNNLGLWTPGTPLPVAYDTIFNLGEVPFDLTALHLLYGNVGFSLSDSIGGALDLSPIPVGGRRVIEIQFQPLPSKVALDSIVYGNGCELKSVAVTGSGGANDFSVSGQTWASELLPAPVGGYQASVTISNLSSISISIDSAWWVDTVHFKPVSTLPVTVLPIPGTAPFIIAYFPDSNSVHTIDQTQGRWYSAQVAPSGIETPRIDLLDGWAVEQSGVNEYDNSQPGITILPTNDGRSLEIILPAGIAGTIGFELVNVLGESVLRSTIGPGTQNVDASSLPRGVYFYRLSSAQINQSGKVILGE